MTYSLMTHHKTEERALVNPMVSTFKILRQLQEMDSEQNQLSDAEKSEPSLREKRQELSNGISIAHFSLYERIRRARQGIGVTQVSGNSCVGCHIILPIQFLTNVNRSESIEQCPNCKRILDVML